MTNQGERPANELRRTGRRRTIIAACLALAVGVAMAIPAAVRASGGPTPNPTAIGWRATLADGVTTTGSNTISSATANFTAADVGFGIIGTFGNNVAAIPTTPCAASPCSYTTITAVIDQHTATISNNALKTATTVTFSIGFAPAGLYGWGAATQPDGSILMGNYWNFRIDHFNADGTPASPLVFAGNVGVGANKNQAPFGVCVDTTGGNFAGDVYVMGGSEFQVNQYGPTGGYIDSWGTAQTKSDHLVNFNYPSQCAVDPATEKVYISNQWGKNLAILDPASAGVQFVTPPAPNTVIQARGMAFDSASNLWVADEGHKRIDIFTRAQLDTGISNVSAPAFTIKAPVCPPNDPSCLTTTFDMRGLAIDTVKNLAFVANGQNCYVQEFKADPALLSSNNSGLYQFNFNGVPLGTSNCGTGPGQFGDGARDIAVDGNHDVWVGDLADFRAQRFDENGAVLSAVPSTPAPPPTGGFNGPRGAAFDASGNMFVTDMYNERIEQFAPTGGGGYTFTRQWGMRGDGPGTFNYPRLLCVDPANGYLIVADTDSSIVVAWDVTQSPPKVAWPTSGKSQGLMDPYGVACAPNGTIYVADSNHKNVAVLNADGSSAGPPIGGSSLGFTRGIAVDPIDGSIWVDSTTGNKVYHFATNGTQLSPSFTTGAGSSPFGIAVDAGYVYVALSSTNVVAQYDRTTSALVGTFGGFGVPIGKMQTPQGLTFGPGPGNNLYVVENNGQRITSWNVP